MTARPTFIGLLIGALIAPVALGASTIAVALPALSRDLGLSDPQAVWALAGYVLATAMSVAVFGRLGDARGVRAVLLSAAGLIAVGALVSALSDSFGMLIAGRLIQGAGAGAMPVAGFAIVGARFEGAQRAAVLGVATAFLSVVSGSGTLIGGAIADVVSWRLVVLLPALSLPAILAVLPLAPAAPARGRRLDVAGAALVAVLSSALVLLLETPSIHLAGGIVAALGVVAAATAVALVRHVREHPHGFIPASVARSRRFVLGTLAAMSVYCGYLALLFAAPLLLLREHDWSTTQIGLILLPAAAMGAVSARYVGTLIATRDPFRIAALLAVASTLGLLLAGVADGSPGWTMLALGLVLTGFVASQGGLLSHVPLAVDPAVRSVATGLFQLAGLLGGAMGSAAVAGLSDPLGLAGAVACVAVVPAAGVVFALAAGAVPQGEPVLARAAASR
jgi:MFS family permease